MTENEEVCVAAINFHAEWGAKAANLDRILALAGEAAGQGARIVVFPELALTGYNHDHGSIAMQERDAETVPGPAADRLVARARELGIWLVVGMPERDAASGLLYNSALVAGPEGLVECYRKIHPAGDESLWAAKGNRPCMFDTPWGPVGLGICYDSYAFPELARYFSAHGARIYLNATAVPDYPHWRELYYTMLRARVVENGLFIVSANLVGEDRNLAFPGGSMVVGPGRRFLEVLYHGEPVEDREAIVTARLDLPRADKARAKLPILVPNAITGTPDWRPEICRSLLDDVMATPKWRATR